MASASSGHTDRPSEFPFDTPSGAGAHAVSDRVAVDAPGGDVSLLAGLASGDPDREIAFIRRFQNRVYGLAHRLVGDSGLPEDVAQEAFLRAWRHAPRYDPRRGSVATWLLAITRNLAIDALRRRRAVPVDPDVLIFLAFDSQAKTPDELAVDTDAASRLREVIKRLPTEQRRAVVLAFFYGQTAQEISISEGIPLGTAKTRIRSGMNKLRAATLAEAAAS